MEFYLIHLIPTEDTRLEDIQKKLNLAVDWFRFGENQWIVFTKSRALMWYKRLEDFFKPNGNIVIVRLDINDIKGWMPRGFWNWVKACKERNDKKLSPVLAPKSEFFNK